MISPSSLTNLAGADLTSAGFNSSSFSWSFVSPSSGAEPPLTNTTAALDSFQNVFAQISSSNPTQATPSSSADYTQTNTARSTSGAGTAAAPAVSARQAGGPWPAVDQTKGSGSAASPSVQNPERSNRKSSTPGAPQQVAKQATLRLGSTSIPTATPNPAPHPARNLGGAAAPPSDSNASAPLPTTDDPSQSSGGSNTSSSSSAPQNAMPVSAASALGGSQNLSGAAFALHITVAPNQGHTVPGTAPANTAQSGANPAVQNPAAQNQAAQNQTGQNQSGPNQDGQPPAAPGADPAANTPVAANAADPQATLQTANLAALNPWIASAAATPPGPSSSSPALTASMATGEVTAEDSAGAPQTVRSVQVQLSGEGEGRVDLRLVEHAGGLSVSVRASDSALTKGLQDNLPELSARLAEEKYQTHTFLPAANEAGGSASSSQEQSSGQASEQQSSGRSFSQGGDGRQSGGQTGGQTGGQSDNGQPSDSGAAWRRQMAALSALSSSVSNSLPAAQSSANQLINQPIGQTTNS